MMDVGIVLATYNSERYLSEQLDSLIRQTFSNWRCYIHDDGSNDCTRDIIDAYCIKYPDHFLYLDYEPQGSAKKNFMSMLQYVDEPYVMFSDHDDVWLDIKIQKSISRIKEIEKKTSNKGILVFSDVSVVDENLNTICDSYSKYTGYIPQQYLSLNKILVKNVSNGCTMIMNRNLLNVIMRCCDYEKIVMHDYWFILVAAATGIIDYIEEPLMLYRQHGDNVCGAVKDRSFLARRVADLQRIRKTSISEYISQKRKWISDRRQQASLLFLLDTNICSEDIVKDFIDLGKKSWIERMLFYYRNNMFVKRQFTRLIFWG